MICSHQIYCENLFILQWLLKILIFTPELKKKTEILNENEINCMKKIICLLNISGDNTFI